MNTARSMYELLLLKRLFGLSKTVPLSLQLPDQSQRKCLLGPTFPMLLVLAMHQDTRHQIVRLSTLGYLPPLYLLLLLIPLYILLINGRLIVYTKIFF